MTPQPIPILLYHSISNQASTAFEPWHVRIDRFAAHIDYLARAGFTALTISGLRAMLDSQQTLPDRPVVITFDDGFADFALAAEPILLRHGLPTTFYITTAFVGATSRWLQREGEDERPFLTWGQIAALDRNLVEVGAHGHTHAMLDVLPPHRAAFEITESKRLLEEHLGKRIDSFAYPHGYSSARVRRTVRDAGFKSACIVGHAMNSSVADPFSMPRIVVTSDTTVDDLARLTRGDGLRVAPLREQYRAKVWRITRRAIATVGPPALNRPGVRRGAP